MIPQTMRVETINVCNEKCYFCPYPDLSRDKGKMTEELYRHILKQHSVISNPKLLFPANIGEPLLDKRLPYFIEIASKEFGYKEIATFSNATLLNLDTAKALIKAGLKEIMLTLHGLKEQNFVEITGFKDYNLVKKNIINFILLNTEMGNPVKIFLDIYSEYTVEEAQKDDVVKVALENNVHLTLEPLINTHNWAGKKGEIKNLRNVGCDRIYNQFGVLHNGNVNPCCVDTEGQYIFGNANDSSLLEIFSGNMRKHLVEMEKTNNLHKISLCKYCDLDCHKKIEPAVLSC
ncbi:radical SAM/SPASM domain-containing protein [Bacillus pseudomycoides]|uniref:radical SAM/SPASM domain-containing protein n=1 Tax=Bacillus pseudomycoides TaxID=64104 RepID=UPI0015CF3108|nr:radical SAM protein [Bacillus pseudomycoides]